MRRRLTLSVLASLAVAGLVVAAATGGEPAPDTTPPILTLPSSVVAEATSSSGASVSFAHSADDPEEGPVPVTCTPSSGSLFPLGDTTVDCSASDSVPNTADGSFTVTVEDTTGPVLGGLTNRVVEATTPTGRTVAYTPTANDAVDGSRPVSCDPASGSFFTVAGSPHTVECSASDTSGNPSSGSFTVTVTDADPDAPTFGALPDLLVEADGPAGSQVSYGSITAGDPQQGAITAVCSPPSGSTFPLATTTVGCTATDGDGNTGNGSFTVTVQDTTPPVLVVPGNLTILSQAAIASTSTILQSWLRFVSATDLVDPSPTVTHTLPSIVPQGETVVAFTAVDDAGNSATILRDVVVTPGGGTPPSSPIPPEVEPDLAPGNVASARALAGDRTATLTWANPAAADFAHVEILRRPGRNGEVESLVYRGAAERFRDTRLSNGTEYRYLIVAYDEAGNRAVGVAVLVVARARLLVAPGAGARVFRAPRLAWKAVRGASYYNIQVFRGNRKVLSVWPRRTRFQLRSSWRFEGRRYRLTPARYTWYVWPGLGPKAQSRYGDLVGQSTFVFARRR